jgi:hypothetical protein
MSWLNSVNDVVATHQGACAPRILPVTRNLRFLHSNQSRNADSGPRKDGFFILQLPHAWKKTSASKISALLFCGIPMSFKGVDTFSNCDVLLPAPLNQNRKNSPSEGVWNFLNHFVCFDFCMETRRETAHD